MPVVMVIGIIAILVGVFVVATGRGGEMAYEHADHAPLDLGPVSETDVALLRPPTALWGYNMQVTDEALDRIARALRDRDIEIASLQRQVADLSHTQGRLAEHGSLAGLAEAVGTSPHSVLQDEGPSADDNGSRQVSDENAGAAEVQQKPGDPDDEIGAAEEQGW